MSHISGDNGAHVQNGAHKKMADKVEWRMKKNEKFKAFTHYHLYTTGQLLNEAGEKLQKL